MIKEVSTVSDMPTGQLIRLYRIDRKKSMANVVAQCYECRNNDTAVFVRLKMSEALCPEDFQHRQDVRSMVSSLVKRVKPFDASEVRQFAGRIGLLDWIGITPPSNCGDLHQAAFHSSANWRRLRLVATSTNSQFRTIQFRTITPDVSTKVDVRFRDYLVCRKRRRFTAHHGSTGTTSWCRSCPRSTLPRAGRGASRRVSATIERHVVRPIAVREVLRKHGLHLKRGLLLHGPPGTGKTPTVRYLLGRLTGPP